MAVMRGLVLLFLVFSLEYAAAQGNSCPLTTKPQTPTTQASSKRILTIPVPASTPRPQTTTKKPVTVTPAKPCAVGWRRFEAKCFRFFPESVNWARAEKLCQASGGNLASVRTKAQNDFLLSLVPAKTRAWIGGHDGEVDGVWLWSNGATFDYNNWCSGEPNNLWGRSLENCLELNWTNKRCWNDETCTNKMGYICGRKHR